MYPRLIYRGVNLLRTPHNTFSVYETASGVFKAVIHSGYENGGEVVALEGLTASQVGEFLIDHLDW